MGTKPLALSVFVLSILEGGAGDRGRRFYRGVAMRLTTVAIIGLATVLLGACRDQGPAAPMGAVRATVSTVGLDLDADGYTVTVDGTPLQAVSINATVIVDPVTRGSHPLALSDVVANCSVVGANPRPVVVVTSDTIDVTFTVVCTATFTAVTAGGAHTCGTTAGGGTYCWGSNYLGELGDGTGAWRAVPAPVTGGLHFTAMNAAWLNSCGLTAMGAVYCWGANQNGQLGVGTRNGPEDCGFIPGDVPCSHTPVRVAGSLTFVSISVGSDDSCAVMQTGAAYCWGRNQVGQLGLGTSTGPEDCGVSCATAPMATLGGLTFATVSAGGAHSCGVVSSRAAYCWGSNDRGQLGVGTTTGPEDCGLDLPPCSTRPVAVLGGLSFTAVSAGGYHTCGVTTTGAAYCWGDNHEGGLGDGTTTYRSSPVPVLGGLRFAAVSAGEFHTCGVTVEGAAYCWGENYAGGLGDGTTTYRSSPVPVLGGLRFAAVSTGGSYTCGVTVEGTAYCWGSNSAGQLGDSASATLSNVPVKVWGSR